MSDLPAPVDDGAADGLEGQQLPGTRLAATSGPPADLGDLGAAVYGLSAQPLAEQQAFARREAMPYPLLNDSDLVLAGRLGLPTFEAGGMRLYRRLTLVARGGRIEKAFYPVSPPDTHAADVVGWLRATVHS